MHTRLGNLILCILANYVLTEASVALKFNNLIQEMIQKYDLHQLTIFTDNLSNVNEKPQNYLFQNIVNQIPIMVINLTKVKSTADNRSLEMPVFQNSRTSTVYVILQDKTSNNLKKIYNTLDDFIAISPISTRPKCLLILYNTDNDWSENRLKQILRYAWSLKFLDFSILNILTVDHVIYANYNPFMESYSMDSLGTGIDIFPDKLNNMNNYSLKIPYIQTPPILLFHQKSNGDIVAGNGSSYMFLNTLSRKLNFILNFIIIDNFKIHGTNVGFCDHVIQSLENNVCNISPIYAMITAYLYQREILIGNFITTNKLIFIVPVILNSEVEFTFDVAFYIACFPLILAIFVFAMHLPKFRSEQLEVLNIFQIFVGIPTLQPRNSAAARIVFFTMAILSMIYSSGFFSKLNEIKLTKYELAFDKFEDFVKSQLPIYSSIKANDYDTEEVKKLLSVSKKISNPFTCTDMLIKSNNAICLRGYTGSRSMVKSHLNTHGNPTMKISDLSFRHNFAAYAYEKASPFIEKFNKIGQQIIESGLFSKWSSDDFPKIAGPQVEETLINHNMSNTLLMYILLTITFIGHLLAIITFFCEWVMYRFNLHIIYNIVL